MKVLVTLDGCDDSTDVRMEVGDSELLVLQQLATLSQDIGGGCQPTMKVYTPHPYKDDGLSCDICWKYSDDEIHTKG